MITFCAPTLDNDRPVARIPRFIDSRNSVEWNKKIQKKPMAPTIVPNMSGFMEPNLDIITPDAGPTTSNIRAKGSCTFAALIGSPPNPTGWGF